MLNDRDIAALERLALAIEKLAGPRTAIDDTGKVTLSYAASDGDACKPYVDAMLKAKGAVKK